MAEAVRLKPDARLRKAWFVDGAMSHPAKGHLGLWWEILERYTQPGQWVLDPMGGIGSTLMACLMGRNVVAVEMETHFLEPMAASWAKMQRVGPMLGHSMGQALILRGDARMLPLQSADAIVTSPPYEGSVDDTKTGTSRGIRTRFFGNETTEGRQGYSQGYTRPVDAVITSPPYEGIVGDHKEGPGAGAHEGRYGRWGKGTAKQNSYTQVDAVVTSPPYEGTRADGSALQGEMANLGGFHAYTNEETYRWHTERDQSNIGNLRGDRYWEAMEAVYRECHRVLIPGGVMALVVKGYTRAKVYQDLPQLTADLIEALGFQVFDRWTREVPLSFWRTLQKQNGNWDEALRYEHVIAARKVGAGTSGVDAIVTSPPYENAVHPGGTASPKDTTGLLDRFQYTGPEAP